VEDYQPWKSCDVVNNRPPAMIIEIYVNTKELASNQSLVIHDEFGKRWDIEEAVRSYCESRPGSDNRQSNLDIILERWHIELGDTEQALPSDLGAVLPKVYKNSIVLFRSLFSMMSLLPAWRLSKKSQKSRPAFPLPKLQYRVYRGDKPPKKNDIDGLSIPLLDTQSQMLEEYDFGSIESPAGQFSAKVTYRTNCDFRIENSEAILSSQFIDEDMFKPSLGHRPTQEPVGRQPELGSLPQTRREIADIAEQAQAYGSLSTFHNAGHRISSSPLSALRAARDLNSASPTDSPPTKIPPDHRLAQGSRSSLRSEGAAPMGRRTSVSFMPFKSPSLSASPSPLQDQMAAASPRTLPTNSRPSALTALAEARNPLHAQQNTSGSYVPSAVSEAASPSVSSSPRPTPRYSSSFGHRRARLSVGGNKGDDDNNSSGRASLSSSNAPPGSTILNEGGNASSGSLNTDDDNISDFLKMLDQKKDLKSFRTPPDPMAGDVSTRRTSAALSKFSRLRDSNALLSDSMSSSMLGHRSSSSSSRQLSSVPPMVAGNSLSTASSPGERMSPRTPHTPAIPSRLSANSIIEYNNQRERSAGQNAVPEGDEGEEEQDARARDRETGAIDIPTSPRIFQPSFRRSSSVAQQHRAIAYDEDIGDILPFGLRSASLGGGEEREPLSLSALLTLQEEAGVAMPILTGHPTNPNGGVDMSRQRSSSSQEDRNYDGNGSARGAYRPRIGRGHGRGQTPPHGSSTSLTGDRGSTSGGSDNRGTRYSYPRNTNFEDEEPLLFAMSELGTGQQGRRSLEDGRRGSAASGNDNTALRGNRRGGQGWT
jgi:autophagy-related protein 13